MNLPDYNFDEIKYATDQATFEKAKELYKNGKVTKVEADFGRYSAKVLGTSYYNVNISAKKYDKGNCDCYVASNGTLCKHMVALAIHVVKNGLPLSVDELKASTDVSCSNIIADISEQEMDIIKLAITKSLKYLKAYTGPSKTWDANQNSLCEGCAMLSEIVSGLPVNSKSARLLVDLLLRLDKKLTHGGVDDSNGTVGNFMMQVVDVLLEFAKLEPNCIELFSKLKNIESCFGFEEQLLDRLKKHEI